MPFNGSGVYSPPSLPGSFNPAIVGQPATASDWNSLLADITTALSTTICKDGQSSITANIPFGTHKITGLGDPASAQDAATKNYVDTTVATAPFTGARLSFLGTTSQVPSGWVLLRGMSIGNASSGATERANADCEALFELLWPNTNFTLQDSSGSTVARGADAATDWAANRRLVLPNYTNIFPYAVSDGTKSPGQTGGSSNPSYTVTGSTSGSLSVSGSTSNLNSASVTVPHGNGVGSGVDTSLAGAGTYSLNGGSLSISGSASGSLSVTGTATTTSNLPPYVVELALIKL